MEIKEMFLTPNKYSRPQTPLKKVTKIAVHYVGNPGSSAISNRNYFEGLAKSGARYVSAHFVVGIGGDVIQCIPTDEISYCTNQANGYSISIECCHPDSTGRFTTETETALAELCAYLCKQFGLDPDKDIIRHYDVTGKQCPLYWSPTKYTSAEVANARFAAFKVRVKQAMGCEVGVIEDKPSVPFKVRILDPELNIRAQPSLTAKICGVIRDKGVYTIVETQHGGNILWGKLKSGAGWISLGSKYVKRI